MDPTERVNVCENKSVPADVGGSETVSMRVTTSLRQCVCGWEGGLSAGAHVYN